MNISPQKIAIILTVSTAERKREKKRLKIFSFKWNFYFNTHIILYFYHHKRLHASASNAKKIFIKPKYAYKNDFLVLSWGMLVGGGVNKKC
jgi:hypothetical protein